MRFVPDLPLWSCTALIASTAVVAKRKAESQLIPISGQTEASKAHAVFTLHTHQP